MMHKYFTEISTKSSTLSEYFKSGEAREAHLSGYIGWDGFLLEPDIYLSEPFLGAINEQFPIRFGGIIKMAPKMVYKWHQDRDRKGGINMLLTANDSSHCLFTAHDSEETLQLEVSELYYKEDTFYLFNTQERHMVLNLDKPRYLFSIEFEDHPPYGALVKWANKNGWTDESK